MSTCRRETLGDSRTIVFAVVRPSEQLPWIGWRLSSAACSQAPSSCDALTQKRLPKSHGERNVSLVEGRGPESPRDSEEASRSLSLPARRGGSVPKEAPPSS